jgi:hypothetical protein
MRAHVGKLIRSNNYTPAQAATKAGSKCVSGTPLLALLLLPLPLLLVRALERALEL